MGKESTQFFREILYLVKGVGTQLGQIEHAIEFKLEEAEVEGSVEQPVFTDLLDLSDSLRNIVLQISRLEEATLSEIVQALKGDRQQIQAQIRLLVERKYLEEIRRGDQIVYRVSLHMRKPRELPPSIWDALEQRIEQGIYA